MRLVDMLFYSFSSLLLLSSFMVVVVQNTVYSVLFLVLSFISAAGLLFLLECDFMSFLFIIVYVGAIAVLFLFVVIMLDVKTVSTRKNYLKYFPFASVIGFVLFVEIIYIIFDTFQSNPYIEDSFFKLNHYINWYDKIDAISENEAVGQVLYTEYVFQFLIAGNILLLSVIGAVVLTLNRRSGYLAKKQMDFRQLSRVSRNVLVSSK
jgi:NADH-quinone oxidoreductase subunit J